jgi:hypothetical protein
MLGKMTALTDEERAARFFKVLKVDSGWCIAPAATRQMTYRTKTEAVEAAKACLARSGGVLTIHGANGRLEHLTVLGGDAARRLNAVEGIAPDAASRRFIKQLVGKSQTAAQRRAAILGHFKKVKSS